MDSFLMQKTNFDVEILIGEDCSTDNTKMIVEDYVKKYPGKIRMITSEQNVGGRANAMRIQRESKGKYIAICEGDDYWTDPFKLQKQVDYMESHPECSLCFHSAGIEYASSKPVKRLIKPYRGSRVSPTEDIIKGGGGFCPTPSLFYPKKMMDHPPGFYRKAPVGDYPMQMYLASQGYAYYLDECMAVYRSDVDGSWTRRVFYGANIRSGLITVYSGLIRSLEEFNEFTGKRFENAVNEVKLTLEYELHVLEKRKIGMNAQKYRSLSIWSKMKLRTKINIRCHFPRLFLMLSNIKLLRANKV